MQVEGNRVVRAEEVNNVLNCEYFLDEASNRGEIHSSVVLNS